MSYRPPSGDVSGEEVRVAHVHDRAPCRRILAELHRCRVHAFSLRVRADLSSGGCALALAADRTSASQWLKMISSSPPSTARAHMPNEM